MQDAFIPVWIEQVLESMNRGRGSTVIDAAWVPTLLPTEALT